MRAFENRAQLNLPTDNIQTVPITMRDGHKDEILVVHPKRTPTNESPLIVLIFGGGFVIGSKEDMLASAQKLQDAFGATVVLATYRRAPEHRFPTAPHDVWDCFEFAAKNAESFGASTKAGFIVGGISAGGNLAAVTARKAVEEQYPLTGAWLDIPALLDHDIVPDKYKSVYLARQQNAKAHILNEEHIEYIKKYYQYDSKSVDYSPLAYSSPAKDMPPTFIQVCGQDPLRDDGLIYARVLQDAGIPTRLNIYPGVPHGFHAIYPQLTLAQKYEKDTIDGMSWLLKRPVQ
jgi:acetyl esterase/lipase